MPYCHSEALVVTLRKCNSFALRNISNVFDWELRLANKGATSDDANSVGKALTPDRPEGTWEDLDEPPPPATIRLTDVNVGAFPMCNGLTRLESRFWGRDDALQSAVDLAGKDLAAADALAAEVVTFTPDDLDWEDEVRLLLEERNSFSPDALTGMEANHRFVGPETMESKIFSRLSAWQNWIFQRPNAVGPDGALRRFGSGSRPSYDPKRV